LWSYGSLKSQDIEKIKFFAFFKNDQLWENFQNSALQGFIATSTDVLCSNFVKLG